jgi:aldehyde dehydrogenase (NAD+)/succinate-semialdehyde dehydrogenase/glutarate-semialdehyde dehydrogenase
MANNNLFDAPALAVGNSVILKPSEQTPLVAELFINIE